MGEEQNIPRENTKNQTSSSKPGESKNISLPAPQPQTSNLESQTTNMEVHKHPHHVTHKKKWPEYFLEFFMIFLAVFLGFLAENGRERMVEAQREREYMQMMTEDLQQDITWANSWLKQALSFPRGMDSLTHICWSEKYDDAGVKIMYSLSERYMKKLALNLTNRTSAQLKNADGMRLIRNHKVSDLISEYWNQETEINNIYDNYEGFRKNTREVSFRIFNYKYFEKIDMNRQNSGETKQSLLDDNPKILIEYANHIATMRGILIVFFLPAMQEHMKTSSELVRVINNYYHLHE
jgi:hypothetical protein